MIKRDAENTVRTLLRGFPVVTITGPRQSGKTTLAKAIFPDKPYVSLEDPDNRLSALEDPRSFLERFPNGGVLDDVQRCPELLSYLQTFVDGDGRVGLFILTGSQQFGLISRITQSLAGRTAFVELLPFSVPELIRAAKLPQNSDSLLCSGFYPPLYDREVSARNWFSAHITAYIERDVRQLLKIQELETFQRFVRMCAARTGQLLNMSSLATECGITHNTVKAWISVLEASYIIFLLRPHHVNFNKRLVKMPKLYFYDVGLVSSLLGIRSPEQMNIHHLRGNIFETLVIAELVKSHYNKGEKSAIYFWRDNNGNEVDVIAETGVSLMPIEIKSGKTLTRESFAGIEKWLALAKQMNPIMPSLVYGGEGNYIQNNVRVLGWKLSGDVIQPVMDT